MAKYAEGTSVSIAQSRAEIERLLTRYGATGFIYGVVEDNSVAAIAFEMKGRRMRFSLHYPRLDAFNRTARNMVRTPAQRKVAYDQEIRRLWRSLTMIIKAKLEAIEAGVTTLEEEFMAQTVMPNNQTVSEWFAPQIDELYRTGKVPPLLPGVSKSGQKQIGTDWVEGEVVG